MPITRDDIKSIQSDITELLFYAKNTSSANVSHKMPSILNRLNEIDMKLKNILFSDVDDRTQEEKDIQKFIDISNAKDSMLFQDICTSSGFDPINVPTKEFTIGVNINKQNTNQSYMSKDNIVPTPIYSDIDMQNFAKWTLSNLIYYYDIPLNKWYDRNTFESKTWEEIFNIYKDEKNVGI